MDKVIMIGATKFQNTIPSLWGGGGVSGTYTSNLDCMIDFGKVPKVWAN